MEEHMKHSLEYHIEYLSLSLFVYLFLLLLVSYRFYRLISLLERKNPPPKLVEPLS